MDRLVMKIEDLVRNSQGSEVIIKKDDLITLVEWAESRTSENTRQLLSVLEKERREKIDATERAAILRDRVTLLEAKIAANSAATVPASPAKSTTKAKKAPTKKRGRAKKNV